MARKLITVFGATGNQGGSVVSAILSSPQLSSKYSLRAITRDPSKPNAQSLASKGVELAKADLNDSASVSEAIKGSYGVFAVTNYWETAIKDDELRQGRNIVDACKAQGVKHLVWSSLPNVTKMTGGALSRVEHFDSKAEVAEYAEQHKGGMLATYFMPAFFMSNLLGMAKVGDDGNISIPWNAEKTWVPMIDIRVDTGKYVAGILEAGPDANGVEVQAVSDWVRPKQIAEVVGKHVGKNVGFKEKEMNETIIAGMDRLTGELMENMILIRDYSYYGKGTEKKQAESDRFHIDGKKTTWEGFAAAQKWQ